jgi:hypothetical protein
MSASEPSTPPCRRRSNATTCGFTGTTGRSDISDMAWITVGERSVLRAAIG